MQGVAREMGQDNGTNLERIVRLLATFWHYCIVYIAEIFGINVKKGEKIVENM